MTVTACSYRRDTPRTAPEELRYQLMQALLSHVPPIRLSMAGTPLRLLLIGHEATRTGAPVILLQLLRWLCAREQFECEVLLARGGALVPEYQKLARTTVIEEIVEQGWLARNGFVGRVLRKLKLDGWREALLRKRVLWLLRTKNPDLLYCNSIASYRALEYLVSIHSPMICHVHELDFSFRQGVGPEGSRKIVDRATKCIACSSTVAEYLQFTQGVAANRIATVHEFIPITKADGRVAGMAEAESALASSGIPLNAAVVAACGSLSWRKGTDLFIQLALQVRAAMPDREVRFVWVGGFRGTDGPTMAELEHDLRIAKLERHVIILGEQPDTSPFLARCDVFVLPSREDPFPLVCLEAANLGKPIVCFRDAGGIPEFVEEDCGVVVPYLDVNAMTAAVVQLLQDPALRQGLGENARRKVAARHSVEDGVRSIEKVILEVIGQSHVL